MRSFTLFKKSGAAVGTKNFWFEKKGFPMSGINNTAKASNLPHGASRQLYMVDRKWYREFIHRHPEIPLRQPQGTPFGRGRRLCK